MDLTFSISVYLVVWWTVLFAILPLGTRTYREMGIEVTDGGDPGAPYKPDMKRKFFTTTWVAAILFAVIWVAYSVYLAHSAASPVIVD